MLTFVLGVTPLLRQLGTKSTVNAPTPINLHEPSLPPTPHGQDFDLTKQAESSGPAVLPTETKSEGIGAEMLISAADYDPTQEAIADREKRLKDAGTVQEAKDVADGVGEPVLIDDKANVEEDEYEEVEIEEEEEEDDLDMFALFGAEEKPKKSRKVTVRRLKTKGANGEVQHVEVKSKPVPRPAAAAATMADNADDGDGYYRITPGEVLDDGRYQITITLGKGMFSAVVKAKVLKAVDQERRQDVVGREVAIKVIRSQESMWVPHSYGLSVADEEQVCGWAERSWYTQKAERCRSGGQETYCQDGADF